MPVEGRSLKQYVTPMTLRCRTPEFTPGCKLRETISAQFNARLNFQPLDNVTDRNQPLFLRYTAGGRRIAARIRPARYELQ